MKTHYCFTMIYVSGLNRCINDTCLEVPVRYVAENWAIPCYEFIAVNICKPFCTCFCKSCCNTEADNAVENTEDVSMNVK